MNCKKVSNKIIKWLVDQSEKSNTIGFVVGVSGGVDSALVSKLCAMTELHTILIQMPINRKEGEISQRANRHLVSILANHSNVDSLTHDLGHAYTSFVTTLGIIPNDLTKANIASRLRMVSAYTFANQYNCLVVGTGNKVEDFGIGFFTKNGDGGVDISPIGDLLKSEVRELSAYLGIADDIVNAIPTDELWEDGRSDEIAIGANYDELEWAMEYTHGTTLMECTPTKRQERVLEIYTARHLANLHKMMMPPICKLGNKK